MRRLEGSERVEACGSEVGGAGTVARVDGEDEGMTVDQILSIMEEGQSAYTNRLEFKQCPYGTLNEAKCWHTGWLISYKEDGQPLSRWDWMDARIYEQEQADSERVIQEAIASGELDEERRVPKHVAEARDRALAETSAPRSGPQPSERNAVEATTTKKEMP